MGRAEPPPPLRYTSAQNTEGKGSASQSQDAAPKAYTSAPASSPIMDLPMWELQVPTNRVLLAAIKISAKNSEHKNGTPVWGLAAAGRRSALGVCVGGGGVPGIAQVSRGTCPGGDKCEFAVDGHFSTSSGPFQSRPGARGRDGQGSPTRTHARLRLAYAVLPASNGEGVRALPPHARHRQSPPPPVRPRKASPHLDGNPHSHKQSSSHDHLSVIICVCL